MGDTSEGGVTPGTAAHQEALRSSGLLNFFGSAGKREDLQPVVKAAVCSGLLSNRGRRWKAFLMGRIIGQSSKMSLIPLRVEAAALRLFQIPKSYYSCFYTLVSLL